MIKVVAVPVSWILKQKHLVQVHLSGLHKRAVNAISSVSRVSDAIDKEVCLTVEIRVRTV